MASLVSQPEAAQALQERALAITEAAYGPDHPRVATDLNTLATILYALGQPGAARPLLERALSIEEAAHGPDHRAVAARLFNLAVILHDLGQVEAAQPLLERALAIELTTESSNPGRSDNWPTTLPALATRSIPANGAPSDALGT